jgi:Cu-Zn family superoxide dismutase
MVATSMPARGGRPTIPVRYDDGFGKLPIPAIGTFDHVACVGAERSTGMLRHAIAWTGMLTVALGIAACREEPAVGEERSTERTSPPPGAPRPESAPLGTLLAPPADTTPTDTTGKAAPRSVDVVMEAKSGAAIAGSAKLVEEKDGVRVTVEVTKAPAGKHGLHIHEKGDCSDPKAESAGAHLSLPGQKHGLPAGNRHDGDDPKAAMHAGDLGNIDIGRDGRGRLEHFVEGATLEPGRPTSLADRAIVLHEKEDVGGEPAGQSGGRIGCGVIRAAATAPR